MTRRSKEHLSKRLADKVKSKDKKDFHKAFENVANKEIIRQRMVLCMGFHYFCIPATHLTQTLLITNLVLFVVSSLVEDVVNIS